MVLLRDFTNDDIDSLVAILNDDAVTRFLSSKIASPYTKDDALWWITDGSVGDLVKAISVNDELVGCIGVNRGEFEYQKSGEIGYWLAKEYWRQGIMSSAIEQMSRHVFLNTDIVRLFASVFSGNQASMQLLLSAGFKQEAILDKAIYKNGHFFNNHVFAKRR
jgi:RimJ/RimL family protein N-acetyltransferase